MIQLKSRFVSLFLAMYAARGWIYTQGYFLGWLCQLARYDTVILTKLAQLEQQYHVKKP